MKVLDIGSLHHLILVLGVNNRYIGPWLYYIMLIKSYSRLHRIDINTILTLQHIVDHTIVITSTVLITAYIADHTILPTTLYACLHHIVDYIILMSTSY